MRRIELDLPTIVRLYWHGLSIFEIGDQMGVCGVTIQRRLRAAGVVRRSPSEARRGRPGRFYPNAQPLKDESWLRREYAEKSSTAIAGGLGVSHVTVCRALNRYGLKTQETHDAHISRNHQTSERAAAQRREKNGRHLSGLQRMLGMSLYKLGFTDIRAEEPFGPFSADWYSPSLDLIFEADGPHHGLPGHAESDAVRDAAIGLPVIRLDTTDIRRLARATGVV
jgi:very-short-patch-repair endonuclease